MVEVRPTGQVLGAVIEGAEPLERLERAGFRHRPWRARTLRRCLLPAPTTRHRSAESLRRPLRGPGSERLRTRTRSRASGGHDPLQHSGGRQADRLRRCRPGLAHRHVLAQTIAFANVLYGIKVPGGTASRSARPSSATCTRPTKASRRNQDAARRQERHARLQEVLGDDARGARQPAAAPHRRAAGQEAAGVAADFSRIRSPGRRSSTPIPATRCGSTAAGGGERRDAGIPVRAPGQAKYRYVHTWTEGDVLMWDNIGTIHNAHADYGPDEHRLIKRCQVMADQVFDPAFTAQAVFA